MGRPFESVDTVLSALLEANYVADRALATSVFLARRLGRPLFLEGDAGVGKTEVAKVLSAIVGSDLIRLQCYEGLDVNTAVYEWNYPRQILQIRLAEAGGKDPSASVFGEEFLIRRPLLLAIEGARDDDAPPVLLIDELDRADEEFEAFLLELLSDFQITIPELGTVRSDRPPIVVITSNRTREIHDALKRRCLYFWIDHPSYEKELAIVRRRLPEVSESLAEQVVAFVQGLRDGERFQELYKVPGIAETLDWARALVALDKSELSREVVGDTLGVLLKYDEDIRMVRESGLEELLAASA